MSFQIKTLTLSLITLLFLSGCSAYRSFSNWSGNYRNYDAGTSSTPEKVIDSKAMHRATMKPYNVHGKWYYPTVVTVGSTYNGLASWYGPNFHGRQTSNGEVFNMYHKTAAHKTLPMNTILKVTNKNNGKSTVVRINDRGPFVGTRIIDLSKAAAQEISMIGTGTAPVRLEILGFHGKIATLNSEEAKEEVSISDYYVQIGAFKILDGAKRYQKQHAVIDERYKATIKGYEIENGRIYRVLLSGFQSEQEARDFIDQGQFSGAYILRE